MSGRNECVDVALSELSKYGLTGRVESRGKHLEVSWVYQGVSRFVTVSATPSDRRSVLNTRADVRRTLRAQGVEPLPAKVIAVQKAFSLPTPNDTGAVRLATLERDFEALLDVVGDLQTQLGSARADVSILTKRLGSLRVEARVVFDGSEKEALPVAAELLPTARKRSQRETVLDVLADGRWHTTAELIAALGVVPKHIGSALNRIKLEGLIENGQRGYWRRVPQQATAAPA